MSVWEVIGVIIAILTLAGAVIWHLIQTVWWMATLTASLKAVELAVIDIKTVLAKHEASNYTKEDASRDFAVRDQRIDAAWNHIDSLDRIINGMKTEILTAINNHQNGCRAYDQK